MQIGCARVEQFEVIGELGHGAHGRAGGSHGVRLINGDRRRNTVDALNPRLVHAIEKLARVGRKRLDVATLTFGIERVEDERGFARARDPGDDDQFVQRQLERDVLEVILAGAVNSDAVWHAV